MKTFKKIVNIVNNAGSSSHAIIYRDGIILHIKKYDYAQNKDYEYNYKLLTSIQLPDGINRIVVHNIDFLRLGIPFAVRSFKEYHEGLKQEVLYLDFVYETGKHIDHVAHRDIVCYKSGSGKWLDITGNIYAQGSAVNNEVDTSNAIYISDIKDYEYFEEVK